MVGPPNNKNNLPSEKKYNAVFPPQDRANLEAIMDYTRIDNVSEVLRGVVKVVRLFTKLYDAGYSFHADRTNPNGTMDTIPLYDSTFFPLRVEKKKPE
ncbi:hypothetical protein KY358_01205 [Candidatus Woesearchaeota archaeon]|nr:hypothetical protein [Candidatus Woesearchaeota archaeon]